MKQNQKTRISGRRLLQVIILIFSVPIVLLSFLFVLVRFEVIGELPSEKEIASIENPNASELYASDGKLIGRFFIENRTNLDFEDLGRYYTDALIATEDIRFYEHNGIDVRSLARVAVKSVLMQQSSSGGGSTLTQQLVKNLYPREEYRFFSLIINKFREMSIARRIEKVYSKDQILLLYSNTVSFGELAFGLKTGSERFFNKKPDKLMLEEAATLVGILKAPSYYSPRNHPERARQRRDIVLRQMAKYDFITAKVANELSDLPLKIDYQPPRQKVQSARYFKEQVRREFDEWSLGESREDGSKYSLYTDGLKVYSTLDLDMQSAAEEEMRVHMKKLQQIFEQSWRGGKMFGSDTRLIDERIRKDRLYASLKKQGKGKQEILTEFTTKARRQVWSWDGSGAESMTKIDSIKHYLGLLHAGVLAVDPHTGEIKVWVGGNDFGQFQWDNIVSPRQVGSIFKPIVYLAALEKGVRPCDYYENKRKTYSGYKDWSPQNADGKYGGHMPMQGALTHSVNTISVQILFEAGIPAVVELARRLGITSDLAEVPSIVLGTSDVSLYEMVKAFSVFANRGIASDFHMISRIEDSDGNVLFERSLQDDTKPIVEPYLIKQLSSMLSNVTEEGTGRRLYANYAIPFQVMGKTGTTQNQSDGLFIGYTDRLLIGAWVGTMDRRVHFRSLGTGSGGRTALPLAGALFEYAATTGYVPDSDFTVQAYACPTYLPGEDYAVLQLMHVEEMIELLESDWNTDLQASRNERKKISRRDKEARKKANEEITRIKKERRDRLEAYKRQRERWRKVIKELESIDN
jgi:penicillin-binding protein 1A